MGETTLEGILGMVSQLTGGVTSMIGDFTKLWIVFLPVTFVVFGFLFSKFRKLLFYRGKRGRR